MFPEKNMSSKMLSKVRRTNEIVSEKRTVESSEQRRIPTGGGPPQLLR
jgi:hypothetical protein